MVVRAYIRYICLKRQLTQDNKIHTYIHIPFLIKLNAMYVCTHPRIKSVKISGMHARALVGVPPAAICAQTQREKLEKG